MTYESIVKNWIRGEAFTALSELLEEQGIDHTDIVTSRVKIDADYRWETLIDVAFGGTWVTYTVCGTVDDLEGVQVVSVKKDKKIVWMFDYIAREDLGIEKFEAYDKEVL